VSPGTGFPRARDFVMESRGFMLIAMIYRGRWTNVQYRYIPVGP